MKTITFKHFLTMLMAACMLAFSSCSKEESPQPKEEDIRASALGDYRYEMKFYDILGGSPDYLGSGYDETGLASIRRSAQDPSMLEVVEEGEVIIRMTNITETNEGFSFDIPVETFWRDGATLYVEGYEYFEAHGQKHEGLFHSSDQQVKAAIRAEVDGVPIMFTIEGAKK